MRWMLRRPSASSKSAWLPSRRSKVAMISALLEPSPARPAQREDERKTEPRLVVGVELANLRQFLRRAVGEARPRLLAGRLACQRCVLHRAAGEFGVDSDQRELRIVAGVADGLHQRELQVREAPERSRRPGAFGDPRRMLVRAVEERDELGGRRAVELGQGQCHRDHS